MLERAGALRVLRNVKESVDLILEIPPGNMLLNCWDPKLRAASRRCAALYRNRSETALVRLAAVGGIVYQIRCNLIHGSKDPDKERDRMLVRESVAVLKVLVPELEKSLSEVTPAV